MSMGPSHYLLNAVIVWILNAFAIMLTANLLPGMAIDGFITAMLAALVLAIAHTLLFPLLVLLTLPITILSFGLFLLVLYGAMLKITASMIDGFQVDGWLPAIFGAIILSLVQTLFRSAVKNMGLPR